MANTGNVFVATGENNAGIGATAWTNPGNVVSDNTTDATCNAAASSQYLVARNCDFSGIPDGSTINGITVRVEASEHSTGNESLNAQLQNDAGTLIGSSKAATISGTAKAVYTYGGTSDTWGASLTSAIVKDADFGVRLWFTTAHDVRIDYVTIAVEYTYSIAVGAGSGTFSGYAPTLVEQQVIPIPVGSGSFSGQTPLRTEFKDVPAGSGSFSGQTPYPAFSGGGGPGLMLVFALNLEVVASPTIVIPAGSAAFSGYSPAQVHTFPMSAGSGTFTGYGPIQAFTSPIAAGSGAFAGYVPLATHFLDVPAGSGTFSGSAPSLTEVIVLPIPAGSAAFAGYAPNRTEFIDIAAGSAAFTGYIPTPGESLIMPVPAGSGAFAGYAPNATVFVDVGTGTATFSGYIPLSGAFWDVPAGSGSFTGYAPLRTEFVDVAAGSGTFAGSIPAVAETILIAVPAGSATFAGSAPLVTHFLDVPVGSGVFAGYDQTLAEAIAVGVGTAAFAGYEPTAGTSGAIDIGAGSAAFSGYAPEVTAFIDVPAGSGTFTGYIPALLGVAPPEQPAEQPSGGWDVFRAEQRILRQRAKKKKLEQAIEQEIAALLNDQPAVPAEQAEPDYLAELRAIIDEGISRDKEFRRFIEQLQLGQLEDELARLLRIEAAILKKARQRRDEEEFIQILLMAA